MQIAVIEDNREDREQLCSMIGHYCLTQGVSAEITCFSSGDALLTDFQPGRFQCAFLDIYMEGTDGMETARQLYQQDPACRLIFCTVSTSHAVASYEVRAAWYLTKPVSARRLADAMDAACAQALHNSRSLTVHLHGTQLLVRFADIYFVDCHDRQARIHLRQRTLEVNESVNELLGRLSEDERFLLCNRNTAVNMDWIDWAEDHDFRLKNGDAVPIRQRGRAALKKQYLAWTLRELRREERV